MPCLISRLTGLWALIFALWFCSLPVQAQTEEDPTPTSPVPRIPEPLVFDLMRPLHAKAGELEINVLGLFQRRGPALWAPELEYAVADGVAIEFEFPFERSDWEASKFGAQFRLGHNEKSVHGIQLLAEKALHQRDTQLNALYLFGHRFDEKWSVMSMSGARYSFPRAQGGGWEGLQNVSLFHNTTDHLVTGLEVDWVFNSKNLLRDILIMPQAHLELGEHCSVQLGVGTQKSLADSWQTVYAVRTILSW